jgi:chemotaxis-related protein WspB
MLFLLFQLGKDRYALEAGRIVEVVPLVTLKELPQAPKGFVGIFNYRGNPVPALDLSQLTSGTPSRECFSTRIIIVNHPDGRGATHFLGLIAERATDVIRKDPREFVDPGVRIGGAAYLGPVLMDPQGPIQWVHEQRLLPDPVRNVLFAKTPTALHEAN